MESALNQGGEKKEAAGDGAAPPASAAPTKDLNNPATINGDPAEKSWREGLPAELKDDPALHVFNDISGLAKSYVHTKKMLGADKVSLPSKHATEEDYQSFYDQIGRPKLEEYKVSLPKDSKFIDETLIKELTPLAHKSGILPKQLEPIVNWYNESMSKAQATMDKEKEDGIKAGLEGLKKEYGEAYNQKLSFAHQLLKEHATPELLKLVDEDKALGNNPALIKMLSKVGELLYKEDGMPEPGQSSGGKRTPDEARHAANAILSDAQHPYNLNEHPNHAAAVKEVQELWKMAYPDQEKS